MHQIRETVHLQDGGHASVALQKPKTSQQKLQSRAMAGPCHLIQDDIPSRRRCQPTVSQRSRTCPSAAPAGLGCGRRAALVLGALCWEPRAEEPVSAAERVPAGGRAHSDPGISGRLTVGAAAAPLSSAAWPGAPGHRQVLLLALSRGAGSF